MIEPKADTIVVAKLAQHLVALLKSRLNGIKITPTPCGKVVRAELRKIFQRLWQYRPLIQRVLPGKAITLNSSLLNQRQGIRVVANM